jgi:FkbH-like protein
MDATDPQTWKLLEHWQTHLSSQMEEDRTKLYQEAVARDQFLATAPAESEKEDEAAAFADLGLSVKLETVNKAGLKRVVELINRTNQFNLCGSRTTLRDEETGLGDDHYIITASAKDKFGSMGVVGVMRVDTKPDRVEVPIFVLSCRVFGFGIEYALLNAVRKLAPEDQPIVGRYKETQANQPGRQLYAKAGLTFDGESWTGKVADLGAPPEWLAVENEVKA